VRAVGDQMFAGEGAKLLLAGLAMHTDMGPDETASAAFGWLLAMLGQQFGFPVPVGGAQRITDAMVHRLARRGGHVLTEAAVERVVVRDRRALGVLCADGRRFRARRAVLADVPAPTLYRHLVGAGHLPPRLVDDLLGFTWDDGTVKVDWALSGPIPWRAAPQAQPGTVHLAESVDEVDRAMTQVSSHTVPDRPFVLMGQMAAADPSRAPEGGEAVWAYTHVPQHTARDAGGEIRGTWDRADAEAMADRMQRRIEEYAPGFGDRVLARRILGPRELAERDENLHNGALNGGTSGLHQQLVFRPVAGLGRAETPVRNLYLGSASAHPGGGVHGACGSNAARAALAHSRLRRLVPGGWGARREPDTTTKSTPDRKVDRA